MTGWRKSSYSNPSGNCVQVRPGRRVQVRDSRDPAGPVLKFTPAQWAAFVAGAKDAGRIPG